MSPSRSHRHRHARSASPYRGDNYNMAYTSDSSTESEEEAHPYRHSRNKSRLWYDSDLSDVDWPIIPPIPPRAKSYHSLTRINYGLNPVYIPKVRHYSIESLNHLSKKRKRSRHQHKSPSAKGKEFGSYYGREEVNKSHRIGSSYSRLPSTQYYSSKESIRRSRQNSSFEKKAHRGRNDSEGSVEKELRQYTDDSNKEVAEIPAITTWSKEESWRRNEPRYQVPDPEYLARMGTGIGYNKPGLRRIEQHDNGTDTKIEHEIKSSTTIPTTLKLSHKYEFPKELEWHRWLFNINKLSGMIAIVGAGVLLTGVGTEPLSGVQLALVIIGFLSGAFILLSSLYCVIYPEHRSISKAKYLTYIRIIHSIGHVIFALLLIAFGIWVFVRNRNGTDAGKYDEIRGDIGMLMMAAGALMLIIAVGSIILGFLAIDKLKLWLPFEELKS